MEVSIPISSKKSIQPSGPTLLNAPGGKSCRFDEWRWSSGGKGLKKLWVSYLSRYEGGMKPTMALVSSITCPSPSIIVLPLYAIKHSSSYFFFHRRRVVKTAFGTFGFRVNATL